MLKLTSMALDRIKTDALIIPVCSDRNLYESSPAASLTKQALQISTFGGDKDEDVTLHQLTGLAAQRIVFMGLGQLADLTIEGFRQAAGKAIRLVQQSTPGDAVLAVPEIQAGDNLNREAILAAMAEGALLSNHCHNRYQSDPKRHALKSIRFHTDAALARKSRSILKDIQAVGRGTLQARDWINQPANEKTPDQLARQMAQTARRQGVEATILDEKKLASLKMGALLAVGRGSAHPPRILILDHRPAKAAGTVALIGKGITFDAGGLNMKPTGSIELMKIDMAGAAAVAASIIAMAEMGVRRRIVGVIPLAENMVSGDAFRPGDIVRACNGRTIEIGNTDAEGRLILADALAYTAKTYRPQIMIDMATLTGACVVALGESIAGGSWGLSPWRKTWCPGTLFARETSSGPVTIARSKSAIPMPKGA